MVKMGEGEWVLLCCICLELEMGEEKEDNVSTFPPSQSFSFFLILVLLPFWIVLFCHVWLCSMPFLFQWRKKLMNCCVSILIFFSIWIQLILDFSDWWRKGVLGCKQLKGGHGRIEEERKMRERTKKKRVVFKIKKLMITFFNYIPM